MTGPGPGGPSPSSPASAVSASGGAPAVVAPSTAAAPGRGTVPERVQHAVLAHPDVVRLSGGPFGAISSYLPGRRVEGVVLGDGDEPSRIGVVLRLGAPVQATAAALRRVVAAETGARVVDVVVTDLEAVP